MIGLSFMIESKNIIVSKRKHNPCPQGVYDVVRKTNNNVTIREEVI